MTYWQRSIATCISVASLGALVAPAFGQVAPPVPAGPVAPTREALKPGGENAPPPKSVAHVDEHAAFAPGPCPLSDNALTVAIHQVQFTAPGGGELPPVIAHLMEGFNVPEGVSPIKVVCELRDQANGRLRAARYVATVQIPPQRIENGVLRLEIVSGHITEVRVRGDAGPFEELIRNRIEKLKALNPLNAAEAERLLVLANDVPGLTVRLGLSPSSSGNPGELIGDLNVSYQRFSAIANIQNYNSALLGRETFYVRNEFYGLLGMNDQTFVAAAGTFDFKMQKVAQIGESIGLTDAGDRLSLTGTFAYSRPKLDSIDLRTLSIITDLDYTRPLVRTVNSKISMSMGFEYVLQRTRVYGTSGSVPLNRDRLASLYARVEGSTRQLRFDGSQKWSLSGSLELHQGLDILGATKTGQISADGYAPTHFVGSATATILRGQVGGTYALGSVLELATTLRGQYSNRALLNYDTFSLGNLSVGRGYDPGANTGDRAVAGAHEIRGNIPISRDATLQPYTFFDWVQLWNLDPSSTERARFLRSVGGGARLTLFNSVRLDVTYARPLDPPLLTGVNIKRSPDRLMFSLTAQLYPFGARR